MTKIAKLKLISETTSTDTIGQPVVSESSKEIIAMEVRSVTRAEFSAGKQNGLSPEIFFVVSAFAYNGEEICEYNGTRYQIYRTYESDDNTVELYAQREVGVSSYVPPSGGSDNG